MSTKPKRTCPSCGNESSGAMEFCPVCMFREALIGDAESAESSPEDLLRPTSQETARLYEHYDSFCAQSIDRTAGV